MRGKVQGQLNTLSSVCYCPRERENIQDLEAYPVHGDCLTPEICDSDIVIINKSLTPGDGDIVIAPWRRIVAYYRINQDGHPYLKNGSGTYEIPSGATCKVVIEVNRKLNKGGKLK